MTRIVAITVVALTAVGVVTWTAMQQGPPADEAQVHHDDASSIDERELRADATGGVTVRRGERGMVQLVGTEPGEAVPAPGDADDEPPESVAADHLARYQALWGLDNKGTSVRATRTRKAAGKAPIVRFEQTINGMPVFGASLAVALDNQGDLQSVSGKTTPLTLPPEKPTVPRAKARQIALRRAADKHGIGASELHTREPAAYVYDPALVGARDVPGLSRVWRVEVLGPPEIRHVILVDRVTGEVALDYNQVPHADRVVCDQNYARDTTDTKPTCATTTAFRTEGTAPTGVADADAVYQHTGDTTSFFESNVGVPSLTELIGWDDPAEAGGKRLRSTVRYCPSTTVQTTCDESTPYRNAFWNGRGSYYGKAYPLADDVVGHELAHGVTQHTSGLMYKYQSGAINESMSDVFGELVDLTNGTDAGASRPWLLGEDTGRVIRNMADPTAIRAPDRMTSPNYRADVWRYDHGGVHTNSGVGNKAAYLIAAPGTRTFNGQTITGIGYVKAAKVYYRAEHMLPSGGDYEDLYNVLPQACRDLAATGSGIAEGDCPTVTKAVTATEMNLQPLSEDAAAPEARVGCDPDAKQDLFFDGFEQSAASWSVTSGMWGRVIGYARSDKISLYGKEPDIPNGNPETTYATLTRTFDVSSGVSTYLRFDHVYGLAYWPGDATNPERVYRAGARLQYRADSGPWQSASGLPWENGPSRTIEPYDPSTGTYGTPYTAFGGDSHGYVSSRLDLSSLAGKTVQFRWRIDGYRASRLDGWMLDNVNVYSCDTPSAPGTTTTTATGPVGDTTEEPTTTTPQTTTPLTDVAITRSVTPATITFGSTTKISGTVSRADTGLGQPGLRVVLMSRKKGTTTWRDVVATTTDSGGAYTFTVKPPTNREFRVRYDSDDTTYLSSTSAIAKATVRQRVNSWFTDPTVTRGTTTTLRGAVRPGHPGQVIQLQRYYSGGWHTVARRNLTSTSTYAFPVRHHMAGTYTYRTYRSGHLDHAAGFSPVRKLFVR